MKRRRLSSYVRPYRLRWGLTQEQLAFLIGIKRRKFIAQLEGQKCNPRLSIIFALHAVFGTHSSDLFPELLREVQDAVIARARELYERLQGNSSRATRLKLDFLEEMIARLEDNRNSPI